MKWCITDANGLVLSFGTAQDTATHENFSHMLNIGQNINKNVDQSLQINIGDYYADGVHKPRPVRPSVFHDFDDASFSWVLRETFMDEAKAAARERITNLRDAAEREPFIAHGRPFDASDKAVQRLLGASQAAAIAKQLGKPFSIEWTCADNTTLIMDADMLIEIPVVMAQAADALHKKARLLKERIDAATTLEEITAIAW